MRTTHLPHRNLPTDMTGGLDRIVYDERRDGHLRAFRDGQIIEKIHLAFHDIDVGNYNEADSCLCKDL